MEEELGQIREALEVLCLDTLETPLAEVIEWDDDGEITVAVQQLAAALDRIEQNTLTPEEARDILANGILPLALRPKLERIAQSE